MSFGGVKLISVQVDDLRVVMDKTAISATQAGVAIDKVTTIAKSAEEVLAKLNAELSKVGASAMQGSPGLVGETWSPEQTIAGRGGPVSAGAGGQQYAQSLQSFADRIKAVMGPNNYFAGVIETEIPYLKAGARTPQEALAFLQNVLGSFMAGIQQELADPRTSPAMRLLEQQLEMLIIGGQLPQ